MNMVSMGKAHIVNDAHKQVIEAKHKIIDRHTNTTHQLVFTANGDGSYELDTLVDEKVADSIEYLIGMMAAVEEIQRIEELAQIMTMLDEATGGQLMNIVVADMLAAGIEVPQELIDLCNPEGMITATIN